MAHDEKAAPEAAAGPGAGPGPGPRPAPAPEPEIPQFYAGRELLVTGASGFLGKVVVERLLALCPRAGRVFVLLRPKRGHSPHERLLALKCSPVFDVVRASGALDKLRVVAGDVTQPALGLAPAALRQLHQVSVILHCAATVKMDERLRAAAELNVVSVLRLLELADRLPNLDVLLHVSTAYCHCERAETLERVYSTPRSFASMLDEALTPRDDYASYVRPKPNTYTYTKMLAEAAVAQRARAPYARAIFRPTIVVSSYRQPFAGWVENRNGPSGVVAAAAAGWLRVLHARAAAADLLPVDMAAHALLAAAWRAAHLPRDQVRVYNCSSSEVPTTWEVLRRSVVRAAREYPSTGALRPPHFILVPNRLVYKVLQLFLQTAPLYLAEGLLRIFSRDKNRPDLRAVSARLSAMNDAVSYFATRSFAFQTDALRDLRARLSPNDRELFDFDTTAIDWERAHRTHVAGCRRFLLKEPDESLPRARARMRRLIFISRAVNIVVPLLVLRALLRNRRASCFIKPITIIINALLFIIRHSSKRIMDIYTFVMFFIKRNRVIK